MSSSKRQQRVMVNKRSLKRRTELSAIKVIKYLFVSSLIVLIIGAIVLFGLAINDIANTSSGIDTIDRYGITELAHKYSDQLREQKLSAVFALILNLLTVLVSVLGIFSVIKDIFILIIVFAALNTLLLVISLWCSSSKAATILLQSLVSLLAVVYTLAIHLRFKLELKRRQHSRQTRVSMNNAKSDVIVANNHTLDKLDYNNVDNSKNNNNNHHKHHSNHDNNHQVFITTSTQFKTNSI